MVRGDAMAWKGIATAIDALVQANRTSPAALDLIAERAVQQWSEMGGGALEVKGTELLGGGQVVLSYESGQGPWLLPAFMAGVRTFRILPTCRPSDMRTLTDELRTLRPEADALARFRDWIWSDGAEGFEVELHMSFMEVMDAAVTDDTHHDALMAFRGESVTSFGVDAQLIASHELDVAALRDEFNVPLELFTRKVARDALRLDPDDAATLADGCENSYGWTRIEIALTLGHPEMRSAITPQRLPEMRSAITPQRLARLITQQLSEALDDRALDLLASLGSREDPYVRALAEALDDPSLGESLAGRATPNAKSALAIRKFFGVCSPKVAIGLATGLVERAKRSPEVFPWVRGVALDLGVPAFMQHLLSHGVREEVAPTVLELVLSTDCTREMLVELFKILPPRVAAAMVVKLPPLRFRQMVDFTATLLAKAEADAVNVLVPALVEADLPESGTLVGQCLQRTLGVGWSTRALHTSCAYLLAKGLGRQFLLPVARASKAEPRVRLLALRTLSTDLALVEESSRWSFSELIEPPEVRARLQEMRKQLKAARTEKGAHS